MSTLHTTLAQDSFRLYFGVIDYVIDHVKKDLIKKGKDEEEATEIANQLQSKWKENLNKSHCIDNKNMMGFNLTETDSNTNNAITNPHDNPNNNANNFNPIQPLQTTFNDIISTNTNTNTNSDLDIGPMRKRQRLSHSNTNNTNNSNAIPPPLQPLQPLPHAPNVIQPNYPRNNPHIQGLGVPQIDQVHNPFTHPLPQSNAFNLPQIDGPSPMKPMTVGFDDEDDEEDDDINDKNESNTNAQSRSMKEENDSDGIEEQKETKNVSAVSSYMVNGRDLTAPLNSEDDDTDNNEDLDPSDKIICQFTKVVRKKNAWTVDLKHGLMHINGKDYAFQKALGGQFSWE